MALCELCLSIPFTSLPQVPDGNDRSSKVADNEEMPELWWRGDDGDLPKDPIGFAWHKGLRALTDSARAGCSLCGLVETGVQIWIGHYRDAEKNCVGWTQFYEATTPIPTEEVLWLTRRIGGGDGFAVLARNPVRPTGVFLLTAVSFAVEGSHPLASVYPLRPIDENSGSQHSLDIAASLLSNCVEKHERCGQEITALPSRVLDVGLTGDMIRLIDSRGLSGKYISLSHCWGSSETLTLTEESYESYLSGISISHLPKTFSDAIIIARHLETRYVWIDSLCIMQENQDDWARESGRMTDVYSNAYLVIAANHAKDGNGGCFHNREARPQAKINLPDLFEIVVQLSYAGEEVRWRGTEFEEEPLSGRGWALQERVLAQRILHYGTRQIYLECNHGIRGEDGCNFDDRYCCNLNDLDGKRELEDRPNYRSRASFEHGMWNNLLRQYGLRKLTKATDKLPAISGLARLFEDYLTADYVAGIWSDDLIEGLAWQSIGNGAPASLTQYTGPSWSWASYGGCAATGLRGHWKDVSQIEEWYVELQNQENPFGEVKSGWIRIHGPLIELKPSEKDTTDHDLILKEIGYTPLPRLRTRYSNNEEGERVKLDHNDVKESGAWHNWKMQVLILCGQDCEAKEAKKTNEQKRTSKEDISELMFYGLVIINAGGEQSSNMARVGWMFLHGEEATKIIEDKECWKSVTLV